MLGLVVLVRKMNFGVNLLGYGVLSIAMYVVFLVWLMATAPSGGNSLKLASWDFARLCDTLATAFSLQGIFIPILKKNTKHEQNNLLLLLSYIIGGIVYTYIGFGGGYGIKCFI